MADASIRSGAEPGDRAAHRRAARRHHPGREQGAQLRKHVLRYASAGCSGSGGAGGDGAPRAAEVAAQGVKVLLIEDSEDILFLVRMALERMGHSIITASDGISGLRQARLHHPDVVISDIKMPGIDGYELIREIRAISELCGVPAIALTGFRAKSDFDKATAAGFDACIGKPAEPEDIAALIQSLTTPNMPLRVTEKRGRQIGVDGSHPASLGAARHETWDRAVSPFSTITTKAREELKNEQAGDYRYEREATQTGSRRSRGWVARWRMCMNPPRRRC